METDPDNNGASRPEDVAAASEQPSLASCLRPKAGTFAAPARGFIPVLLILILFLLAAIFVKPLFFGILAAVLSFKVEQTLERCFFGTKFMRGVHAFLVKLNPFAAIRRYFAHRNGDAPAPDENTGSPDGAMSVAERRRIAARASAMTVILAVVVTILLACAAGSLLKPLASSSGKSMSQWAQNNHVVKKLEQKIEQWLNHLDPPTEENAGMNVRERLRNRFSGMMEEYKADFAKYMFQAGNGLIKNAFHITAWVGTFTFDLVMFLFFYYYFLLKMAVFAAGRKAAGQDLGEWTVNSIYQSGWVPDASESERRAASQIIDHIYGMFRRWLVGYFKIIVVETILYALFFAMFHVPYWQVLAFIAGSTILLPFLGPILAAILAVTATILFAQDGIVMPLIGIALAFLLINGLLEQLLLYPMLVGEAIGLTLVETIIVVLLGAVIAGISGMILAVPAAALLKFLVPIFYETLNKRLRLRRIKRGAPGP